MEEIPDTENVAYMDEYPRISDRLRLRRLALGQRALGPAQIIVLPTPLRDDPDFRSLMEQPPQVLPDTSA